MLPLPPRYRTPFYTLLLSTALVAPAAFAAPAAPDAAGASSLEGQLRTWVKSFLPPAVALPDRPVQVSPEGDHYRASIPLGGAAGTERREITATVRPLDDGRWSIEGLRFPSPATVTVDLPSAEAKPGATAGKQATEPVTYNIKIAEQNGTGTFDPSYRTPSTFAQTYRALTIQANVAGQQQNTQVAALTSRTTLTPAGEGRVDAASDGGFEGYVASSTLPDGTPLKLEFDRVQVNSLLSGLSRDKATEASKALISVFVGIMAAGSAGAPPSAADFDPAVLRSLLATMRDIATEARLDETIDGLRVRVGDAGGSLGAMRVGFGAKSPDGVLNARLDIGLDDPKVASPPLGPYEAFVPRRFSIRPTLSGVQTADLLALADKMMGGVKGGADPSQEIAALFSRGGVQIGLENLVLEVAGATLTGQGKAVMASPADVTGDGQVTITNLDGLIDRVKATPSLAQALPVLVIAKGIGRTAGNATVYDLSYRNGAFLVNGTDLSAMAGGGGGGGNASPPPRSGGGGRTPAQPQTGPQKR